MIRSMVIGTMIGSLIGVTYAVGYRRGEFAANEATIFILKKANDNTKSAISTLQLAKAALSKCIALKEKINEGI